MTKRKDIRGLLFYAKKFQSSLLSYNDDWFDAFNKYAPANFDYCNLADRSWPFILPKLRKYDLIVLLHSTISNSCYVNPLIAKALQYRKGKLVIFIGNEYKLMPEKINLIKKIDADYVASQFTQDIAYWLYAETNATVLSVPHALNPEAFKPIKSQEERTIDIGARYYEYPWYLGDRERVEIHEFFLNNVPKLKLDISSNPADRFQRKGWANFLNNCRGTISTEAGSSFLERDDHTRKQLNAFMNENPEIDFKTVHKRFFADYADPASGKAISSRHFDVIGTKTCQIMFPGRYNDILQPNEHYIALDRDFSNIDDVLERFGDDEYRENMVHSVREYALDAHTHRHRIECLFQNVQVC